MHEFTPDQHVEPFDFGDELPGGGVAVEIGAICPDESAIVFGDLRAVALADGVIRMEQDKGPLAFVPDFLFDDPEKDKAGLRAAYRRLLDEHEFDHLLLAHGGAVLDDGREQLARFVSDN